MTLLGVAVIFIKPHENWTKKHGHVYCQICGDRAKTAYVPTIKTSVVFRREHACCDSCKGEMVKRVDRYMEINYGDSDTEASNLIQHRYGIST